MQRELPSQLGIVETATDLERATGAPTDVGDVAAELRNQIERQAVSVDVESDFTVGRKSRSRHASQCEIDRHRSLGDQEGLASASRRFSASGQRLVRVLDIPADFGNRLSIVGEIGPSEGSLELRVLERSRRVHVERDQSRRVVAALGERDHVGDVEVVDRDVEIRVAFLRYEAVDVDPTVRTVAQLEILHVDACFSPMQRCDACAGPHARIELEPEVIELQLIAKLVERKGGIGAIRTGVVLIDDDLGGAVRLRVGELRSDAVEIEAGRSDASRLGVDPHLGLRSARVDPVVVGGERADRVSAGNDARAGRGPLHVEVSDIARGDAVSAH